MDLKGNDGKRGLDSSASAQRYAAGFFEYGPEHPSSIKLVEFLDQPRAYHVLKEDTVSVVC